MNYATSAQRPNPAAILGALGVPAAFGAVLVAGLAVTVVIPPKPADPPKGFHITPKPIDDPIEKVVETAAPSTNTATTNPIPDAPQPRPLPPSGPISTGFESSGTIGGLPGLGEGTGLGLDGIGIPTPSPLFDPVDAAPRGDPSGWITQRDYRTSWINRGYAGVVGFSLNINASGKVESCSITRSTGYSVLDQATCRLLESRAQFEPARDSKGAPVAGSYSSSVNWKIPG